MGNMSKNQREITGFETISMEFPPGKLTYSVWFSQCPTLRSGIHAPMAGKPVKLGLPGWRLKETPWKPEVSSKKHETNNWETTGIQKESYNEKY